MGPQIQWLHSYVTGDKVYCVYMADNEDLIRRHAKEGGFPANRISEVKTMIDAALKGRKTSGNRRKKRKRKPRPPTSSAPPSA